MNHSWNHDPFQGGGPVPHRPKKQRKPIGTPLGRTLLNLAVTLIFGAVYFYIVLPPLNLHSGEFYVFVLLLCAVYCGCAILTSGFQGSGAKGYFGFVKKQCTVPLIAAAALIATALVGADSRDWDDALIEKLGLPRGIFQPIKTAGTVLGHLTPEIQKAVGFDAEVILPATHDTGSAFLAVPARDEYAAYLSSGTWSLLGVENAAAITGPDSCAANFTNEGGYEYRYRYLKNIMGLWMIQSVRRELGEQTGTRPSFPELIAAAQEASSFAGIVSTGDDRFLAPKSMIKEVKAACKDGGKPVPATTGEVMQTIYNSLSHDYQAAIQELQSLTGKEYTSINIVGGGSQDMYLNQMTANATQLPVFAGPTEGTALGNLMVQMIRAGEFKDLADARASIKKSFTILECDPQ